MDRETRAAGIIFAAAAALALTVVVMPFAADLGAAGWAFAVAPPYVVVAATWFLARPGWWRRGAVAAFAPVAAVWTWFIVAGFVLDEH